MKSLGTEIRLIGLGLLTLLAVLAAVGNVRQERAFHLPDDGVFWVDDEDRVVVGAVSIGSPAEAANLQVGDALLGINGQSVREASQVARLLFDRGVGAHVRYAVLRQDQRMDVELALVAQSPGSSLRLYLRMVGVCYLLLGLFVWLRRFTASRATHFYLFCLASFVLFVFSYTGKLDTLDWIIYGSSVAANLLVPALFAHFCIAYPQIGTGSASPWRRWFLVTMYGVAGLLGAAHFAVAFGVLRVAAPLLHVRWLLDRLEVGFLVAGFLVGISWLAAVYRKASSRFLRKQIGWVLAGSLLGVLPFSALYAIPYFWGVLPRPWMNLSSLSLILLPVVLAYAIVRYRLLDVEVLLRRGMAYTLATAMLVSGYLGVVALAGNFFRTYFPAAGTVGLVLAVIATGLLFQPLQRWIQSKLEHYFLQNRYEYREALLRFGRELSTQTDLNRLIASLQDQLVRTLRVNRAAVFVAEDNGAQRFVLHGAMGLEALSKEDNFGFLGLLEDPQSTAGGAKERLFFPGWGPEIEREWTTAGPETLSWQQTIARMQLHYYFACRSQNRLVAVLGLGAIEEEELLSAEDVALVETLAGYLAVAVDNARLVESLAAKAAQYEQLQQFSEDILESIPVGLAAVDLEGRIEAVNTSLRQMVPLAFAHCRGRKLGEVFPNELVEQFPEAGSPRGTYRLRNARGEERVLNIAVA
ncbi:MAG: PDZ domain-containing protein, partial [Acidobacteria bacterium]|nr:PDZ domain-containing protein [Acidobacteriota bacterium]